MSHPYLGKILIIDDDSFIVDIYLTKFKEEGYLVASAADAKKGLELIRKFKPDVILLDVTLPDVDGFGVLAELKKKNDSPHQKVIFLSNHSEQEYEKRAKASGSDGYFIKAYFTPGEIVTKVKELLTENKTKYSSGIIKEGTEK